MSFFKIKHDLWAYFYKILIHNAIEHQNVFEQLLKHKINHRIHNFIMSTKIQFLMVPECAKTKNVVLVTKKDIPKIDNMISKL